MSKTIGLLLFLLSASRTFAGTIDVAGPVSDPKIGDTFEVDVDVSGIADLYAFQFDLTFDPTLLAADSVTEGAFLPGGGTTFFVPGTIDNTGGDISANADTLIAAIPGVTGDGTLVKFEFTALAAGTSAISFANEILLDSSLNDTTADSTFQNGSVTVSDASTVPEPKTLTFLCVGLLPLMLIRRGPLCRKPPGQLFSIFGLLALLSGAVSGPACATDISTAQFDASRTMANGSEIYLTTSNVNGAKFGKLFSRNVDGAIFAQPLYLQGAVVSSKTINLVYVVTSHDNVYAFNADDPYATAPVWSVNLGQYDMPSGWNTGLGILSTPLIVRSSGTMYLTAATYENGSRIYRLHALDLLTGAEKLAGPVVIAGSVPGTAEDAQNGVITFNPNAHVQRTGLALSGNSVVFAFAGDRDHAPYHGWVFSYNIGTLLQTGVFNDARNNPWDNGTGAGIWQSGRAPAVDANGAVYFETGNGTFDGTMDFGESFLKLVPTTSALSLADWFTPSAWQALNAVDYDLSSTGATLIPGTNLVFGGAKSGMVYLLSTTSLGQLSDGDANVVQSFTATSGCVIPYIGQGCAQIMGQVFWSTAPTPTLFVWGVHDVLRSYRFSNGLFNTAPGSTGTMQGYYPGGVLSLSSYLGTSGTGIVWAITCDTPDNGFYFGPGFSGTATLHAFNANNLASELWNSSQDPLRDDLGAFASFAPPVAVNGKVYVPTFSNQLVVYGLLNGPVPGDVNGDSVVNCADMSIVKNSYGKRTGQAGFDLRADVNGDGVVNIFDLAAVSRRLPVGAVCQ